MAQFVSKVVVVVVVVVVILLAYLGQPLGANLERIVTTEGDNSTRSSVSKESSSAERVVEVKIGFLVGSRRLAGDQRQQYHDHNTAYWPRPGGGRQLKYAFNYAIGKFNQFHSDVYYSASPDNVDHDKQLDDTTNDVDQPMHDDGDDDDNSGPAGRRQTVGLPGRLVKNNNTQSAMLIKIKFQPIIKETYGSESESIRQTIELITKHDVNFILGPQETCQMEPKLASIFNVAMLSHYCTTWSKAGDGIGIGVAGNHDQRIKRQQSSDVVDVDSIRSSTSVPQSPMRAALLPPSPVSLKQPQQQQQQPQPQRHSSTTTTFIQIKPPHWKIVSRVVALVEQLLAVSYATTNNTDNNSLYPQQLVLLYFKPPPPPPPPPAPTKPLSKRSQPTSNRQPHESADKSLYESLTHLASSEANDAIQYRLIGELLEIKLNELIATRRNKKRQKHPKPSLSALNWHTTFHYGYTKNPFRSVLRRHLFPAQPITSTTNQSAAYCKPLDENDDRYRLSSATGQSQSQQQQRQRQFAPKSRVPPDAIYIVVGHYYEHLGLMLALNELNLLPATTVPSFTAAAANSNEQQSTQEPVQSSVGKATAAAAATAASMIMMMRRPSVVIGVDTEPYDERDDSVRFLRGLLMDSAVVAAGDSQSSSPMQSAEGDLDLDSISNLYRAYLGVVPAKPIHSAEFLDEMRSLYANESLSPVATSTVDSFHPETLATLRAAATATTPANNQTQQQQQLQLSARLLQFIRLPVEAFYLYDAVMLLGFYLKDCLLKWGPNGLQKCSQGNRTFEWFRQKDYVSHVTHNWSRFDSWAQAEGSYSLITRRGSSLSNQDDESNSSTTLIPVGYFRQPSKWSDSVPALTNDRIEVHLSDSWDEVDPIWLPFWCHMRKSSNSSNACRHLFKALMQDANNGTQLDDANDEDYEQQPNFGSSYPFRAVAIVVSVALLIALYLVCATGCCWRNTRQKGGSRSKSFNNGWFNELDERNFLELIYKYLIAPEANDSFAVVHPQIDDNGSGQQEQPILAPLRRVDMLNLHCNMFAFPSCIFVHWLTAMYQLKEMLLKFKCNNSDDLKQVAATGTNKQNHSTNLFETLKVSIDKSVAKIRSLSLSMSASSSTTDRQFFSIKHSATNSLRLLLNKYKSTNQCLINLTSLDHVTVANLRGITMSCNVAAAGASSSGRVVYMILEQSDRGDLRQAFSTIIRGRHRRPKGAHSCWMNFRDALIDSLIGDILGGLEFLHKSSIGFHGDLRATTCLISYDWRLKLSGFHANHLRGSLGDYEQKICPGMETRAYFDQLVYSAPELIQSHTKRFSIKPEAMQLADIYSFAFVAYELLSDGLEPWSSCTPVRDSRLVVDRVKEDTSFRPALSRLDLIEHRMFDSECMQRTIRSCWSHSPERRPQSIALLKARFCAGRKQTISIGGQLMRIYTKLIERSCINRQKRLSVLNRRMTDLKMRLLPGSIVSKLNHKQPIVRQHFECVSFGMFRVQFNTETGGSIGGDPIELLSRFMMEVTQIMNQYQDHLHILDSQADSLLRFLVFSGEPLIVRGQTGEDRTGREPARGAPMDHHAQLMASFALQIVDLAARQQNDSVPVQIRCGLHCGPVFGGLLSSSDIGGSVGVGKEASYLHWKREINLARYILIGPTIQVANILELTSQPQRIQISAEFRAQLLFTGRLFPLMSLSSTAATGTESHELDSRQGYVIIKREAKIQHAKVFPASCSNNTVGGVATHFEAYWLLNGPRLTASQSLMLLARTCDTPTGAPTNQADNSWKLCASDESDDNDYDYDYDDDDENDDSDDWHNHNHHWTHLSKPQK